MDAASAAVSRQRRGDAMEWLVLEALVALALAVFIVWFTMGGKREDSSRGVPASAEHDGAGESKGGN
ncbi:MAG: hypothetical protein ABI900_08200 [Betaproteobacteria bacterium]